MPTSNHDRFYVVNMPGSPDLVVRHPLLWRMRIALANPIRAFLCLPPIPPVPLTYSLREILDAARSLGCSEERLTPFASGIRTSRQWRRLQSLMAAETIAKSSARATLSRLTAKAGKGIPRESNSPDTAPVPLG